MLGIDSREATLQAYIDRVKADDVPEDLQSQLRVFAVVQICGYIERCMEIVVLERLKRRAHPRVLEFIKSNFRYGTNFKCSVIKSFIERFDIEWGKRFQTFIDANEDVEDGVESAYAVRNQAAHGNSINIGQAWLQELFEVAKRAVHAAVDATS